MPFLGNLPTDTYKSLAKQTITGDGGTTYTLSNAVTSAVELEVFVNNVRQEPDVAYTASGTQIVFADAIASSDSCYIVYQGKAIASNLIQSQNLASNLEFTGDYIKIPSGTTAQRPGSATTGMLRMNTSTGYPEWFDSVSSSWVNFYTAPPYSIELLIIAGGAAGGRTYAGGGGAGGVLYQTYSASPATNYAITVGAGGAGNAVDGTRTQGNPGSNSVFSTFSSVFTAIGGGGGGANGGPAAAAGGSGGGGASESGAANGGAGTTGQGYAGGGGSTNGTYRGGGGGGAGGAGANGDTSGIGGSAISTYSAWATATSTGVSGAYAGGGGGGGYNAYYSGTIAGGGGGAGYGATANNTAGSGTANTGSGGGGSGGTGNGATSAGVSGNGGSGIVIIRYEGVQKGNGGTIVSSGGYTYHTFTSSGTFTA